jgi:peptide/nickel transport system permease protein
LTVQVALLGDSKARATRPASRLRLLTRSRASLVLCCGYLAIVVFFALFGHLLLPNANADNFVLGLHSPTGAHWLGTDNLGRDVLQRLTSGATSAFVGPVIIATGSFFVGNVLGLAAGYFGSVVESVIMRWADLMYALPSLLVAIVVAGILGGGYFISVLLLTVLSMPYDTRLVRAVTLEQRSRPYVEAARGLNLSSLRIMVRHIWPNVLPLSIGNAFLNFSFAVVNLSALSFLGLGAAPGSSDWGAMLAQSQSLLFQNPYTAIGPAVALILLAISMNIVGDFIFVHFADGGTR